MYLMHLLMMAKSCTIVICGNLVNLLGVWVLLLVGGEKLHSTYSFQQMMMHCTMQIYNEAPYVLKAQVFHKLGSTLRVGKPLIPYFPQRLFIDASSQSTAATFTMPCAVPTDQSFL